MRFTVLASGSAGNASLLQVDGFGLLLDIGLAPRLLAHRLRSVGAAWDDVDAALLTHTHADHWKNATLAHLRRLRIPLYCHAEHHNVLSFYGVAFGILRAEGLVRGYEVAKELYLGPGLRCIPLPLQHDSGVTFGFRFEICSLLLGRSSSLGYAADLGSWDDGLAEALAGVEVLALEFNHDVRLERNSGRSPGLIQRVLGDHGHLSNEQAGELLKEVLRRSPEASLRHLVQLHLSRECNRPDLAAAAAHKILADTRHSLQLHTTCQSMARPTVHLGACANDRSTLWLNGSRISRKAPAVRNHPLPLFAALGLEL